MNIQRIAQVLEADIIYLKDGFDPNIKYAFASDLMSDVLAFAKKSSSVLLTGLVNSQVIRTCEMLDIPCLVFVRGKIPSKEVIGLAQKLGISLLATDFTLYLACGVLFDAGLIGIKAQKMNEKQII